MLETHYIVMSQTIVPENGLVYGIGLIGLFNDLDKAVNAANQELARMNVPEMYHLLRFRRSSGVVLTNAEGMYVEDEKEIVFGIKIDVIGVRQNHVYQTGEELV